VLLWALLFLWLVLPTLVAMQRARIRAGIAGVVLVALLAPASVEAAGPSSPGARERELQEAIGEASADEAAALGELGEIRSARRQLDAAIAEFDVRIREVEARIATIQVEVDRYTAEAVAREAEAAAAQVQLDEAKRRAAAAAAAMYRGEDGVEVYSQVLDVDDVQELFSGGKYLEHLSERRRRDVDALSGLKVQIEALRADAAARRDDARAKQQEAEQERNQIAGLRAEQQKQRDAVAQQEAREHALVTSIRARKEQFAGELAALQAASSAVSSFLAARQRGQQRASSFSVVPPVAGPITGSFGNRVHPVLGTSRMHTGVDMSADQGTPITAGASGVVAWAGPRGGYGNAVIIDHGNQFATLYAHASAVKVASGQRVKAGQVVALAGSTGMSTGPHLHFEVRILGSPVNPASYM
jgi:murein DD-endopeptidase MepM/ murein hydrolase activator NlpD